MIEISGTIFGAPAMQVRLEQTGRNEDGTLHEYSVKVAVRDPEGDHFYNRVIYAHYQQNILGILQDVLDSLPYPESLFCAKGPWTPAQDKNPLELPSA